MPQIHDLNIQSIEPLPTPVEFIEKFPITPQIAQLVSDGREEIAGILRGEGDRLLVIAGPCSIHDVESGLEYATPAEEVGRRRAGPYLGGHASLL